MSTPVNPSFTIYKWGLRGSKLYRYVFVMEGSIYHMLIVVTQKTMSPIWSGVLLLPIYVSVTSNNSVSGQSNTLIRLCELRHAGLDVSAPSLTAYAKTYFLMLLFKGVRNPNDIKCISQRRASQTVKIDTSLVKIGQQITKLLLYE